jgi:SNW domain-containing protein 1
LGQAVKKTGDSMYDSRLFSHGTDTSAGSTSDIYSKPLFNRTAAQGIYRPKANVDVGDYAGEMESLLEGSTNRFKPDRGFDGAEPGGASRDKPVQFEADPFGLGQVFDAKSTRGGGKALQGIGKTGRMEANAGGSRLDRDEASSSRGSGRGHRRMDFTEETRDSSRDKRRRRGD